MDSLPDRYQALVIGATGAIGAAFVDQLKSDPRCAGVVGLSRRSTPPLDLTAPASIAEAADALRAQGPFHLVIVATGILHGQAFMPEKKLEAVSQAQLSETFQINTFGPALVIQQFLPLLHDDGLLAVLSAKVGSIEDNRLGGWYAYRASKAGLNMIVKTAAIECARRWPRKRLIAVHPGTVASALTRPFRPDARAAIDATADMLKVLDSLTPEDSGCFVSYSGERLPW